MKILLAFVLVVLVGRLAYAEDTDDGWHRPIGARVGHGFRVGWMYLDNIERPTREDGKSLMDEYGLKSPHMMLLGYEAFYRVVSHSWLDVLFIGNLTVAGLEQSKFIPAGSALVGAEFSRQLQLGIGVNITPDPDAPTHAIAAVGFTPRIGSIETPLHVFVIPDIAGNSRYGATVGVTW